MSLHGDIPQKVADNIVSALAASGKGQWLGQYAPVNRWFQKAVEAHTFRELYLTSARLDDLNKVMTEQRQEYLRVITLHVGLASYRNWQNDNLESQEDGDQTTRVFTLAIQELFATISTWDQQRLSPSGIHFELLVESPSDEAAQSESRAPNKTKRGREATVGLDVYGEKLPKVNVISALTCSGTGRHVQLETLSLLLSRLPNLRFLDADLEHDTADTDDLDRRRAFILELERCAPNLTQVRFHRPHTPPTSSRTTASGSSGSRSLFYTSLTRYTQRCVHLTFDDCVDARDYLASFEPDGQLEQQHPPYWPYLESIHIKNSYLMRRPYMRVKTRAQAARQIERTILLMGRALRCMPRATDVKLRMYVLAGTRLEQTTVQYDAWDGGARMGFAGATPPARATVDAWRESVMQARGVELQVR